MSVTTTLALGVVERTREIGLLRAVGAQAQQIRTIIRTEALATVTTGALTGLALGLAIGWPLATAIEVYILGPPGVPIPLIVAVLPTAMLAGLLAAALPARHAGHLDILTALRTE
jgi:putative ABC transport system permease protein